MSSVIRVFETVIQETFEQHAFLFSDPIEIAELPDDLVGAIETTLDFGGARSGRIRILCDHELGTEMTTNLLGVDDPSTVPEQEIEDALKELVNVVAGTLLAAIASDGELFDLAPPELRRDLDGSTWQAAIGEKHGCALIVEDYPVLLQMYFD